MKSHEVDYQIIGDDIQLVEVELDPGETVIAEAGAMNYMEDGISFTAKMGDGSKPESGFFGKLMDAGNFKKPEAKILSPSMNHVRFCCDGYSGRRKIDANAGLSAHLQDARFMNPDQGSFQGDVKQIPVQNILITDDLDLSREINPLEITFFTHFNP